MFSCHLHCDWIHCRGVFHSVKIEVNRTGTMGGVGKNSGPEDRGLGKGGPILLGILYPSQYSILIVS